MPSNGQLNAQTLVPAYEQSRAADMNHGRLQIQALGTSMRSAIVVGCGLVSAIHFFPNNVGRVSDWIERIASDPSYPQTRATQGFMKNC